MGIREGAGALLAVALLGLAACGGGSDQKPSTTGDQGGGEGAAPAGSGGGGGSGGDGAESAGSGDVDPCALLEVPEIEEQFGQVGAVSEGARDDSGDTLICSWHVGPPDAVTNYGVVTVSYSPYITEDFADLRGDPVPVDGLGDEAVLISQPSQLAVHTDGQFVGVTVIFTPDVPGTPDKLTALAQHALDRL